MGGVEGTVGSGLTLIRNLTENTIRETGSFLEGSKRDITNFSENAARAFEKGVNDIDRQFNRAMSRLFCGGHEYDGREEERYRNDPERLRRFREEESKNCGSMPYVGVGCSTGVGSGSSVETNCGFIDQNGNRIVVPERK